MNCWSLFVDVEGFSVIYGQDKVRALVLLRELATGIYLIGSKVFPDAPSSRLFAYGLGDGFLIVPDLDTSKAERPLAIAIVLMHHLLSRGGVAKAAISTGDIADISGCFPEQLHDNGKMGDGLLIMYPVMGTALPNSYKLGEQCRGACLVLDPKMVSDLPQGVQLSNGSPPLVDWVHSRFPLLERVSKESGIDLLAAADAKQRLANYIGAEGEKPDSEWIQRTLDSVNCQLDDRH